MGETMLLGKDELLRALAARGVPAAGPTPRERAPWLDLGLEEESWTSYNGLFDRVPAWAAEAGILAAPSGRCLVWLEPRADAVEPFQTTIVLRLPAGRYSALSWGCALGARAGLEVASAPPLVCSPPRSPSPLVLLIEPLA